jgi:hypothetical protein
LIAIRQTSSSYPSPKEKDGASFNAHADVSTTSTNGHCRAWVYR